MKFKTDGGGRALELNDVKISTTKSSSTWNTRLSQIAKIKGSIIIATYSLPDTEYIEKIFRKRSEKVILIFHEKFIEKARKLKESFPAIKLYPMPDIHAKIVLIEPDTVWLSSANFGQSGWFEQTIGMHSREAYRYYYESLCEYVGETL